MMQESPSPRTSLLLILILPVFAIAPLFYPGYIQSHSGFVPLWNVNDLRANLGDLSWVPHIAVNFDPLRSAGLLPYYLAALLPLSPISAVKAVLGFGWLLGSVGVFLWLRSWLGHHGALVAALVYTYLPHQIATVYVRGAWGEALLAGLLPWAILTAVYLVTVPRLALLPIAALFWLMLGLSQLGLTIWVFIFVILFLLICHQGQALWPILAATIGTVLALVLTLAVVPSLGAPPVSFDDHFLFPFQLFSAFWGFGPSRPGWNDGLSLQLGVAAVGLTILSITLWRRNESNGGPISRRDRRLIFFLAAATVLVILQFSPSAFMWKLPLLPGFSLSDTLTYPWQLLGLTGLCLAIVAGTAPRLDPSLTRLPLFGAMIILIILSSYNYLSPQYIQAKQYIGQKPQAQLGDAQLALIEYEFDVLTIDHTVGLEQAEMSIPLAVHGPLQADDILLLKVTWQPLRPFGKDLKVFVHLVDFNHNVVAQYDDQPQSGDYPTSQWVPGELIEDTYPIIWPVTASPGPYQIFLGLYDGATLMRLPVLTDSEGRVIFDVG